MLKKVVGTEKKTVGVFVEVVFWMGLLGLSLYLLGAYLQPRTSVIVGAGLGLFFVIGSGSKLLESLCTRDFLVALGKMFILAAGYSLIGLMIEWRSGIAILVLTLISSTLPLVVLYLLKGGKTLLLGRTSAR